MVMVNRIPSRMANRIPIIISHGCEIKNTLSYIDRVELDIKLEMCEFFNIKPLFIMRFAPKSYIEEIRKEGGFSLIFKYQLYELSQVNLWQGIY